MASAKQSSAPAKPDAGDDDKDQGIGAVLLKVAIRMSDIIQLNLNVGRSRFGEVKLARHRQTEEIYALKALRKSSNSQISILELFELNHCKNERPMLQILKHPFIVNMISSFQDVRVVYFLMDYYPGGNLMRLLSLGKIGVSHARQITAQLIVALEYMHSMGVVHRDLQPSNILFDEQGFIRLCDFNSSILLSVQKEGRAFSCVGCPLYMSPEIVKNRGHGNAADWWSLGCIVFEMLTGYPPFYDVNRLGCYQKILLGHIDCPPSMHAIAKDFVMCCLRLDESERFHTGKTDLFGANVIRGHHWFQDIDWDEIEAKQFIPEWQPCNTLSGKLDLRYSSDVEDAPFAHEYVVTGAAIAGSKKDAFSDF